MSDDFRWTAYGWRPWVTLWLGFFFGGLTHGLPLVFGCLIDLVAFLLTLLIWRTHRPRERVMLICRMPTPRQSDEHPPPYTRVPPNRHRPSQPRAGE